MEMFLTSLISVGLLLAMAVPGFIVIKMKLIKTDAIVSVVSVMLLYVTQPFVTFDSFLNTYYQSSILLDMVIVFVITTVMIVGVCLLTRASVGRFLKDRDSSALVSMGASFGNIGYMCIPFLQLLKPGDSVVILYACTAIVSFNLINWTLGCYILTGERKYISLKKAVLNPPTIAFIISLPLFILNLNFDSLNLSGLAKLCALFSDMVGPLAMTLLGAKLAEMKLKELFGDPRVYISSGIKLIIFPVLAYLILLLLSLFYDIGGIKLNIIALSAMPSATGNMMFAAKFGKDVTLPAKMVVISTLISVVTIPLTLLLFL